VIVVWGCEIKEMLKSVITKEDRLLRIKESIMGEYDQKLAT
jgi:G:T-mismatch repair DNA endonuclease (very short patch repair protein)